VRPGCGWEDNIKIYPKEIVREGVDCVNLSEDRVQCWAPVNIVMNVQVLKMAGNLITCSMQLHISGKLTGNQDVPDALPSYVLSYEFFCSIY
jgi:hypothetical protein